MCRSPTPWATRRTRRCWPACWSAACATAGAVVRLSPSRQHAPTPRSSSTAVLDQFVTGQLLRVDLTAGTAAMVNAGHPRPLHMRDGRVDDIELAANPPFGILPDIGYRVQPVRLMPGDRVVFVTDGVLERNAATADVVGLVAATGDLHPREVVQEINRAVLRAVDGKLRDDPPHYASTGTAEENGTGRSTPARTSTAPPHLEPTHDHASATASRPSQDVPLPSRIDERAKER